jgi:hypothetical protein
LCGFTYNSPVFSNGQGAAGPFTNGSPGIGFFDDNGTGSDWNTFGISSFTAGGSCPSAANYNNPANAVGGLVTLASLGVTTCYYVSASGSDSNDGLTEATPWLHAPQMPNCSANCATVQNQSGGIPPGTGIITRGGDTWHFGTNTGAFAGGKWDFHSGQGPNGTAAHPIYVGNDKSWFSGGSWTRPLLTGDNPLCNASLVNGTTCLTAALGGAGIVQYYVPSCITISGGNDFFGLANKQFYIIDNFEMTGLCQATTGQPQHNDTYFDFAALNGAMWFINNYEHGFTHLQFSGPNGSCSGVCFDAAVMQGGTATPTVRGESMLLNVADFSDSDGAAMAYGYSGFGYQTAYSVIIGTSQFISARNHLFHDNLYCYFYENGHSNLMESDPQSDWNGVNAIYNNHFCHVEDSGATGGVGIDTSPPSTASQYFFNNVGDHIGNLNVWYALGNHNAGNEGQRFVFNNTTDKTFAQAAYICSDVAGQAAYPFTLKNEHLIDDSAPMSASCVSPTNIAAQGNCTSTANCDSTSLGQTHAQANANSSPHFDQYNASQAFVYSPVAATNSTVGAGVDESSLCAALATAAVSDPSLADAAAACGSDTRYACTYTTSNHTVTCPARTALARPTVRDIGAYQSGSSSQQPPSAPTSIPFTAVPLPAAPLIPVLTLSTPTQSYVTTKGFSQDGKTWNASLILTLAGTGFTSGTTCTFNSTGIPCTCGSSTSCTATVPASLVPVPTSRTQYAIAVSNPAVSPPVLQ